MRFGCLGLAASVSEFFSLGFGIFQLGRLFVSMPNMARAPHLAGCSLQQTMNKHFFFYLVFRYKLTTPSFFVMTQGTEAIDGVRQQKECCPWRPFLRTVHLDAHDIAVRPEHFVLMQELRSSRPCVQLSFLWTCSLLELQNEALFELAFPHRNVVAIGILLPASRSVSRKIGELV